MQMGKFGLSRVAYVPKVLTADDLFARVDGNTTHTQMAILRFPTVTMIDTDTVPALASFQINRVRAAGKGVRHAVTRPLHGAVRSGRHTHPHL